jgi:membrane-associated phospholipid phosphatase
VKLRTSLTLALSLVVLPPGLARADEVSVDLPVTGAVTGGAAVAFLVLEATGDALTPGTCRWCEPPGLDRNARLHLRWEDTSRAATLSDLLLVGIPASFVALDYLVLARSDLHRLGEDVLIGLEALAVTAVATDALKYTVARRRPNAWAAGVRNGSGDDNAFVSGHASVTFAAAAAFGTVAMMRGDPSWPLVYAAGFTGAATVSYLRLAADRHWLTDVLAGAALGTGLGVGLPLLLHRKRHEPDGSSVTWAVTPIPLGVAGAF